ncbi:MAG: FKBP-type peptidyl-prolyl cis-trans isomerase [Tannerellaceae bacterium]|jgi:peptidylprolyl isomerase/FKBP-type peptidyl-prolyl cis-trans isomerase FklB|nr:FKBP-type peptidyl-prolyl cis-trans isomerase [Tannerellaceae bacterium]
MTRLTYITSLLCILLILPSCGSSDDPTIDETWKTTNEQAFAAFTYNSDYSRIMSASNMGYIYYAALKQGTGTSNIYYTDTVKVYYTGSLVTDSIFDTAEPPYKAPLEGTVGSFCDGFATALQHMRAGDRWEIWLPSELGYGAAGQTASTGKYVIPPYSTLKFEVELISVKRKGEWKQ